MASSYVFCIYIIYIIYIYIYIYIYIIFAFGVLFGGAFCRDDDIYTGTGIPRVPVCLVGFGVFFLLPQLLFVPPQTSHKQKFIAVPSAFQSVGPVCILDYPTKQPSS